MTAAFQNMTAPILVSRVWNLMQITPGLMAMICILMLLVTHIHTVSAVCPPTHCSPHIVKNSANDNTNTFQQSLLHLTMLPEHVLQQIFSYILVEGGLAGIGILRDIAPEASRLQDLIDGLCGETVYI